MQPQSKRRLIAFLQLVADIAAAGLVIAVLGLIALGFTVKDAAVFVLGSIVFGCLLAYLKHLLSKNSTVQK